MRDYLLHELSTDGFENLVIQLCQQVLGMGTFNFSSGRDGGKDGRFEGTAQKFPDTQNPATGKFIIQAKHSSSPVSSCSDAEFEALVGKETPKVKKFVTNGEADHYMVWTNRKLSAPSEPGLVKKVKDESGVANAWFVGKEKITTWIDSHPEIAKTAGLNRFRTPLQIHPQDLALVIKTFSDKRASIGQGVGSRDFSYVKLVDKNKLNKLSDEYFEYIKTNSEKYFVEIETFLADPKNRAFSQMYENIADELKAKIITYKSNYESFDDILCCVYDLVLERCPELDANRRLISVFLHYMYCNCDIGQKC